MTKPLMAIFALLFAGVMFVSGYWYLMTPQEGRVTKQGSVSGETTSADTSTFLNALTFRVNIPPGYKYQGRAPIAPELESYRIIADRNHQQTISMYVTEQKATTITEDAAYILRASQPEKYQKGDMIIDGNPATTWTARDGSEQTIFSLRDNKLLVIAISMHGQDQTHRSAVESLLDSLRWQ